MRAFTIVVLLALMVACSTSMSEPTSTTRQSSTTTTPINDRLLMDSLLRRAVDEGDAAAYNQVASYYQLENRGSEFLYFALLMAHRYHSVEAAYHVYTILAEAGPGNLFENLSTLDSETRSMAMYYLLKAYEGGFESAADQVEEIYADSSEVGSSSQYAVR